MNNFLEYIRRNSFGLLFFLLEILALIFTAAERKRPKLFFVNSSNFIISSFYSTSYSVFAYLGLKKDNEKLLSEIENIRNNCGTNFRYIPNARDTLKKYKYIKAHIINNSVSKQNNFITIDVGKDGGVMEGDGVISADGVVGVIVNVSNHYSVALSVLNSMSGVSARLKRSKHWGTVVWDGKSYDYLIMEGVPNHIKIQKGDTVVTSSFSTIFPENIDVGYIDSFWRNEEDNFYTIKLKTATDFKSVQNVFITENLHKTEISQLTESTEEMFN